MSPNDADGMANSVDPDQTASRVEGTRETFVTISTRIANSSSVGIPET